MAITSAICTSFKQEILVGTHNFTATSGDTFKIALFTSSASLGAGTTAYQLQMKLQIIWNCLHCRWSNSYKRNTNDFWNNCVCDFADVSYTSASFTANGALIYNDDQSDKAVAVIAFGGDKTVSSGTFTIQFPTADASNAIIRIA